MNIIQIGQPFPHYIQGSGQEGIAFADFNQEDSQLNILLLLDNIQPKEEEFFLNEKLDFSLSTVDEATFLVLYWNKHFSFDTVLPFNLNLSPARDNRITLFLVDRTTGILKSIRVLGVSLTFLDYIKIECDRLRKVFKSTDNLHKKALKVFSLYNTESLRSKHFIQYKSGSPS